MSNQEEPPLTSSPFVSTHTRGPQTATRLLAKMHYTDQEFFNDLLEAKLLYIKTRRFWDSQ